MPDFDWINDGVKPSCKFKSLYDDFTDKLTHFNLEQMVKIPTRDKKYTGSPAYKPFMPLKHYQA